MKYRLFIREEGESTKVHEVNKAEFLPRKGDYFSFEGVGYTVNSVTHSIRKEKKGLETDCVQVFVSP